ncbi:MAG: hypothetical protein DI576_01150 [Actinomyces sp.]|nr:MAG: hypothetical protein DI576_01150 [Actinomyces sp.]
MGVGGLPAACHSLRAGPAVRAHGSPASRVSDVASRIRARADCPRRPCPCRRRPRGRAGAPRRLPAPPLLLPHAPAARHSPAPPFWPHAPAAPPARDRSRRGTRPISTKGRLGRRHVVQTVGLGRRWLRRRRTGQHCRHGQRIMMESLCSAKLRRCDNVV